MAIRVLIASAYFESHRGGIEIVAGRLARELDRLGADVTWLATNATPPPDHATLATRPLAAWNVTERRLGVPLPLPGPGALATIRRQTKAADVLLLHDSLYPTNVALMLAARAMGRPVVLTQHIAAVPYANPVLRGAMAAANAIVTRTMLRAADHVVFISEVVAQHFASLRFRSPPRCIFNGVDVDMFRPPPPGFDGAGARQAMGLPTTGPVVLFVGRFVEKKGLHVVERLARRRPDLTFALAGWGPIDPAAWRLGNVHVLTGLSGAALVPLYQTSDVLLLPSVGEGLPLVLQEALACGLPVVCGRDTAAADAGLAALVDGVALDGGDGNRIVDELARRIDDRLAEAGGADRAVRAGQRHAYAREHYGWPEMAQAYMSLLTSLAGRAAVGAGDTATRTR